MATEKQIKFLYGKGHQLGLKKEELDKLAEELKKKDIPEASKWLRDFSGEARNEDTSQQKGDNRNREILKNLCIKLAVECATRTSEWQEAGNEREGIAIAKRYYDELIKQFGDAQ